jgi:PAS domain S-box-containing protein
MQASSDILVVDDESSSLALLAGMLREEGYEVRPANSGRLALASALAWPPQLILCDIRMPEIDGFELCRRLKAQETTCDIPLIFISSAAEEEDHVRGFALGAVDFINKPLRREELKARVRTHLELAALRHNLEEQVAQRTAELRESEQRFRIMADTAPVMIWTSGPDKLRDFFNTRWLDFTGRSMEQEIGNGWTGGVHPGELKRSLEVYASCFDARRWFQMEYRLRRADGEYRWVVDTGVPRIAPGRGFAGYIGSAIDITDIKRSQEETFDREKLESLRLLTGGIAHDFRNLLGGIIVNAENAEMELPAGTSAAEDVQRIKATAIRATEIVRKLTTYSGEEKGELAPVDLSAVTGEMVELTKTLISKHVVLDVELGTNLPPVWGDAAQIRQIVMNLVINASEAIGGREGCIRVCTSHTVAADGASVRLGVTDTGRGMSEEEKGRVFDPFFTTKSKGHGLGLAVVSGIVESHGGRIQVVSSPGRGATFTIFLPCANGSAARNTTRSSPEPALR